MNLQFVIDLYNRGTAYVHKNKFDKGANLLKKALKLYEFKEAYCNLGNCYRALGNDKGMLECYMKALDSEVPYLETPASIESDTVQHTLNNLGLYYYTFGDDLRAIEYYQKALSNNPKFWDACWNCSTAVLRQASTTGDPELFETGWEFYTARFLKNPPIVLKNKRADLEYWVPGTHVPAIIVLVEQGIGDSIMFGRYVPYLREFADEVYVQCDPSLEPIFKDFKCVRDASEIVGEVVGYPICSLAGAFKKMIPGDWLRGKFDTRKFDSDFNVGIVWSGSPGHVNNAYRSVNIGRFSKLAAHCNLYGLVPGFKGTSHVKSLGIKDWNDTASAINGLDLVIGVDTSVMHMCGSLGRPGWLLQPYRETDFRWGNGTSSVWYDSIRVFKNPQSWEKVFDEVERELIRVKNISG